LEFGSKTKFSGGDRMKYIRVTMPDLSKWDIPADFIAKARAEYYADREVEDCTRTLGTGQVVPPLLWSKTFQEECKITMEDDYELKDWLSDNMNWDDVKDAAEKISEIKLTDEDLQEGIINGEKEIIEK